MSHRIHYKFHVFIVIITAIFQPIHIPCPFTFYNIKLHRPCCLFIQHSHNIHHRTLLFKTCPIFINEAVSSSFIKVSPILKIKDLMVVNIKVSFFNMVPSSLVNVY